MMFWLYNKIALDRCKTKVERNNFRNVKNFSLKVFGVTFFQKGNEKFLAQTNYINPHQRLQVLFCVRFLYLRV